jgi:hypothetical protein
MPGDPNKCREHASLCEELARKARNPNHKRMLDDLAHTWGNLALEIEHGHALLDAYPPSNGRVTPKHPDKHR